MSNNGIGAGSSAEHRTLYANADSLRHSLADRVAQLDRDRAGSETALQEAAQLGLMGIEVPKYLGGLGLGFRQKVRVAEILSRTSMAFAFSLINTHNVAALLAEIGSASHKRDLLPDLLAGRRFGSTALTERGAGSDFTAINTMAERTGDGWLINGEKAWITNAAISDVIICYAQTDPGSGRRGIASFVIDGRRPGFERLPPYQLIGGHLTGTGRFRLTNYRAREEDLLTKPGDGFGAAMASVNGARIYVAAMCCAMVHSALGAAIDYGAKRETFGKRLLDHQGLAWSLASVANQLEAAQLLTERAIDVLEAGELSDVVLAAAHAKKFATEMAEPAISACIQAMGAEGLRQDHPLGRHLADARLANFVDGSTEMQTERIAHSLATSYRAPVFEYPEPQAVDLVADPSETTGAESGDLGSAGPPPPASADQRTDDLDHPDRRKPRSTQESAATLAGLDTPSIAGQSSSPPAPGADLADGLASQGSPADAADPISVPAPSRSDPTDLAAFQAAPTPASTAGQPAVADPTEGPAETPPIPPAPTERAPIVDQTGRTPRTPSTPGNEADQPAATAAGAGSTQPPPPTPNTTATPSQAPAATNQAANQPPAASPSPRPNPSDAAPAAAAGSIDPGTGQSPPDPSAAGGRRSPSSAAAHPTDQGRPLNPTIAAVAAEAARLAKPVDGGAPARPGSSSTSSSPLPAPAEATGRGSSFKSDSTGDDDGDNDREGIGTVTGPVPADGVGTSEGTATGEGVGTGDPASDGAGDELNASDPPAHDPPRSLPPLPPESDRKPDAEPVAGVPPLPSGPPNLPPLPPESLRTDRS